MSELLPKVGKYKFMAEPFHCDFSKKLYGAFGKCNVECCRFSQ